MLALYLAPLVGSGSSSASPIRAKYSVGPRRYGGIRSSRDQTLALVETADQSYFDQLVVDLSVDGQLIKIVSAESGFDASAAAEIPVIASYLEGIGIPGDFLLTHSNFLTYRQVAWYIASMSMLPQRFEPTQGKSVRDALDTRGAGASARQRLGSSLDALWEDVPVALRDEYADVWGTHKKWQRPDFNTAFAGRRFRDVLRAAGDKFDGLFIGGMSLGVPISKSFGRMFAYGDNRVEVATDDFSTDPFAARWLNGEGTWNDMVWAGTDYVEESTTGDCGMKRNNGEAFEPDQYCIGTCEAISGAGALGVSCRKAADPDESGYHGYIGGGGTGDYTIYETGNPINFTVLGTPDPTAAFGAGDTLTLEVEGTTIRLGSDEGGGDTERSTATDNTIADGEPGLAALGTGANISRWDAWAGGNISASASLVPPDTTHKRFFLRGVRR